MTCSNFFSCSSTLKQHYGAGSRHWKNLNDRPKCVTILKRLEAYEKHENRLSLTREDIDKLTGTTFKPQSKPVLRHLYVPSPRMLQLIVEHNNALAGVIEALDKTPLDQKADTFARSFDAQREALEAARDHEAQA